MNDTLLMLDIFYICVYLTIMISLGILSMRKSTSEGFLIANRNLKTVSVTSTILASKTGAGTILTFVALVYLYGISAILVPIGASVGYIFFMFFGVHLKEFSSGKKFYTLSDYFFHKYGNAAGFISAVLVTIVMLVALLSQFIAGAKIITELTSFSFTTSLLMLCVTILIYMVLGGFRAVVLTDIAQLFIIILLLGLLGYVMTSKSIFLLISTSLAVDQTPSLITILSFFMIGVLMPFFSAELWQRVYAAKDVQTVRKSLLISAIVYPIIGILIIIVGLSISTELHGIDPDMALVKGFTDILPPEFFGLGLIILFAAIMSSADSYLFAGVSVLLQDFYARFTTIDKDKLVKLFRYTILALIVAIILLSSRLQSLVSAIFVIGAFGSIISLVGITSWLVKKINSFILIMGMIIGFFGTLLIIFIEPVNATLILKSIALTFTGFIGGSLFNFLIQKRKILIDK
jgi:sodium/pantothenate symporter